MGSKRQLCSLCRLSFTLYKKNKAESIFWFDKDIDLYLTFFPSILFSWLIHEGKYFLEFYFQNFRIQNSFNEMNAKGIST